MDMGFSFTTNGDIVTPESNEHLIGTTNNCDEFYKTWE
jgi:hypothetical protein